MSQRKKLKVVSSGEATGAVAELVRAGSSEARPDPEVRAVAKRRQFNAAYKLSVLTEADQVSEPGAIGALLRREGLYSSQLAQWRREREAGSLEALSRRRGRKTKLSAEQKRIAALGGATPAWSMSSRKRARSSTSKKSSARCWGFRRQRRR